MDSNHRRQYVLAGLLAALLALAAVVLREVLGTVLFAVTVAYVLVPLRDRFVGRGLSRRLASALVAAGAFGVVLAVVGSFGFLLYRRRGTVIDLIERLPEVFLIPVGGMTVAVELQRLIDAGTAVVEAVATGLAVALPVLALKLLLFAILLFGLLLRPGAAGDATFRLVPREYHDVVLALHARVKHTLYGIYVLQAATAFGTALVAGVVFWALGYDGVIALAIVAGILQFVPVLGPSVLIIVLAAVDVAAGATTRAILVLVVGGILIGAVPDAVIRPRLATWAADLPTSLYFIGFVGGVLTVGAIGFIVGPLVVALVVELVDLLSASGGGPAAVAGPPEGDSGVADLGDSDGPG